MKVCTKCILTDKTPNIRFDENGVCHYCSNSRIAPLLGEDELNDRIKYGLALKRRKYDCLIPLSGGIDSSFVLYYAVKVLKLKCLALHVDLFTTDMARTNMERLCGCLGIELRVIKIDRGTVVKEIRKGLECGIDLTPAQCNQWLCQPCGYLVRTGIFNALSEEDIPFYISGKHASEFILFQPCFDVPLLCKIVNRKLLVYLQRKWYEFLRRIKYRNRTDFFDFNNSIFNLGIVNYGYPVLRKRDSFEINLYDYIPYKKSEMAAVLKAETGWQMPEEDHGTVHFDCSIYPLRKYLFKSTFGFSLYRVSLSNQVRYGYINRDEAEALINGYDESDLSYNNIKGIMEDVLGCPQHITEMLIRAGEIYKTKTAVVPDKIGRRGDFVKGF